MLASRHSFARESVVCCDGRCDDDRVEVRVCQHMAIIARGARCRVSPPHCVQTLSVQITNPQKLRRFVVDKIAQQVLPPIAAAYDADSYLIRSHHPFGKKPGVCSLESKDK